MAYVGIDPGLKGAIAIIDDDEISIVDMPTTEVKSGKKNKTVYDLECIRQIFDGFESDTKIFFEKIQTLPNGFTIKSNTGLFYCEGVFTFGFVVYKLDYKLVQPQAWQKHFGISRKHGDTGEQSVSIAQSIFPSVSFKGPRGGLKDGRADAALIALYGKTICQESK